MARRDWSDGPMWVIGTIDAYGAVEGRTSESGTHTDADRARGRCFRWNIWGQEFHATLAAWTGKKDERIDADDHVIIEDWLEREGFKENTLIAL